MTGITAIATSLAGALTEERVQVHSAARERDAVVRGPANIGAHARVTGAYVGPSTAIGNRAAIVTAEKDISASIGLPGARIRHAGVRTDNTTVGAGVPAGRDDILLEAMRVLVGRDAHVRLS